MGWVGLVIGTLHCYCILIKELSFFLKVRTLRITSTCCCILTLYDNYFVHYFREDIDDWELRKGLNMLHGHDLVPEPKIISAALKACRRLNDYAMTVRVFEVIKDKAAGDKEIYNYILQEVKPTIEELGLSTPEELGLAN